MSKSLVFVMLHSDLCFCAQLLNAFVQEVTLKHPHQSTKLHKICLVYDFIKADIELSTLLQVSLGIE